MINLRPVESSMISHIGYDEEDRVLRVRFSKGAEYDYADVPKTAHDALMKAPSIGSHFHKHVRNAYTARKHGIAKKAK